MPLTSLSQVYKTLPSGFADTVVQHTKRSKWSKRLEAIPSINTTQGSTCTGGRDGAEPRHTATGLVAPFTQAVTSPLPPSCSSKPVHTSGSQRATTPRITSSLERVDLWDESEDDDFDHIDGVRINPRSTMDLSELKSQSRTAEVSALNNTFHGYDKSTRAQLKMDERIDDLKVCSKNNRKVKFSNLVMVQEGSFSSVDLLRNSHNSAQTFRQKHLKKAQTDRHLQVLAEEEQCHWTATALTLTTY